MRGKSSSKVGYVFLCLGYDTRPGVTSQPTKKAGRHTRYKLGIKRPCRPPKFISRTSGGEVSARAEVGLVRFARLALRLGAEVLLAWRAKFCKPLFR